MAVGLGRPLGAQFGPRVSEQRLRGACGERREEWEGRAQADAKLVKLEDGLRPKQDDRRDALEEHRLLGRRRRPRLRAALRHGWRLGWRLLAQRVQVAEQLVRLGGAGEAEAEGEEGVVEHVTVRLDEAVHEAAEGEPLPHLQTCSCSACTCTYHAW